MKMDSPQQPGGPEAAAADPAAFWAQVLSGDPDQVRQAMASVSEGERARVVEHLRRMATEDGWQDAQRQRARAALAHLGTPGDSE